LQNLNEKFTTSDPDLEFVIKDMEKTKKISKSTSNNSIKEIKNMLEIDKSTEYSTVANISVKLFINCIRVQLHDKETEMNEHKIIRKSKDAFSKMELNCLQLEFNIYDDTPDEIDNIKIEFLLDSILLNDTRLNEMVKRPTKLIERYTLKNTLPKSMINVSFESKMARDGEDQNDLSYIPEKTIRCLVNNLRLCVNVDYLLLLYGFFVEGLPKSVDTQALKQESVDKIKKINIVVGDDDKSNARQIFLCEVKIENPQFVLYENQFDIKKSNSIVIDGIIYLKLSTIDQKTKIQASLNDFMINMRSFKSKRVLKRSKYLILSPTSLNFTGEINDEQAGGIKEDLDKKKHSFTVDFQEINLNMCPLMLNTSLKMLDSINNSISERFKPEVAEKKEENRISFQSLFQTVSFDSSDFWFTQKKALDGQFFSDTVSTSSSSDSLSSGSRRASESQKPDRSLLIIRTSKIYIKLEASMTEKIPLIGLNLSMRGEFTNWSHKPTLGLAINVEMAYFNEMLAVWEPVIERVEQANETFKPYEILIDMITNNEFDSELGYRLKRKKSLSSEISDQTTNLKPIRTYHVHSPSSLQFVVTRTFLNLLDTIQKSFKVYDQNEASQDDYEFYEQEEERLIEDLKTEMLPNLDTSVEEAGEDDEDYDEENQSFNFLIKNELGYDVSLEPMSGFKFQNLNLLHTNKQRDEGFNNKVFLKNDKYCPISLINNFMSSFKETLLSEEQDKNQSMKFKLEVRLDFVLKVDKLK
jgi:vacuolar protein sorting-associated protein 13A/C